jgi:hypothetical protein
MLLSDAKQAGNILLVKLLQVFIILPDIAHYTAAVTGAVGHQYHNRQGSLSYAFAGCGNA